MNLAAATDDPGKDTPVLIEPAPVRTDASSDAARPTRLPRRGLSTKLSLGASHQRFHSVPLTSGELLAGLGGRMGAFAGYVTLEALYGRTEFGLTAYGGFGGLMAEWRLGRVRLGGQLRTGLLGFERVTKTQADDLTSLGFGARAHAACDVLRLESGHALYVEAFFRSEFYDPLVFAPGAALGFRWEAQSRIGRPQSQGASQSAPE